MKAYKTIRLEPYSKQITVDMILSGETLDINAFKPRNVNRVTRTTLTEIEHDPLTEQKLVLLFRKFNQKYAKFINRDSYEDYYRSFKIPKAHGGFRPIDSPTDELREVHSELKALISRLMEACYHTAAYAYVEGRAPVDAVRKHQQNNSNWCLRTDFGNFFGSTTLDFLTKMLLLQYPFCHMVSDEAKSELKSALSVCFLRRGLPQGSTISPFLTNLMMIPIDYTLQKRLEQDSFVYTRYADDIQVSAYSKFEYRNIVKLIDKTLVSFGAPFKIKQEKTKFSSCAGVNYILGLDYNAEHNITVGYKTKRTFKAMVNNFLCDWKRGRRWSVEDTQYMRGLFSYYHNIEREYFDYLIRHLEEKYHVSFFNAVKLILRGDRT